MRKIIALAGLVAFVSLSGFRAPEIINEDPERYCNTRYNFCLTYPGDIFVESEQSPNDDGILLKSADRDVEMRVTGYYNVMGWSLEDEYDSLLETIMDEGKTTIRELKAKSAGNEMTAMLEMGILDSYVQIIQKGEHFVSLLIVTNRQNANNPKHSIDSLLSKITIEVDEI